MKTSPQPEKITWRAIILGLLPIPLNVYLVVQTETVWTTQYPTTMSILFNAVFTLFLFTLLNLFLIRFLPRWQLTQGELLTIYLMVTLACVVCGHDLLQATMCILDMPHGSQPLKTNGSRFSSVISPHGLPSLIKTRCAVITRAPPPSLKRHISTHGSYPSCHGRYFSQPWPSP